MAVTSASRVRSSRPAATPAEYISAIRSSMPGMPFGTCAKSAAASFCPTRSNEQWSVPTNCTSPLARAAQRASRSDAVRSGGLITNARACRLSSSGRAVLVHVEQEVLRAGLRRDGVAGRPTAPHGIEPEGRGEVDDVVRGVGQGGDDLEAVDGLGLEHGGPGQGVEVGGGVAGRQRGA